MRKFAGALTLGLVLSAPVLPAMANDTGVLIVMPATGTLDTPIDVVTSAVCTRGVTFVVAVRGKGIDPVTSGNAVGNTELRVLEPAQYPDHHAVPLARTLREYFVANGVSTPTGNYDLIFACRNRLDITDLQTFTATIVINKAGAYRAIGAAATPLEEFISQSSPRQVAVSSSGSIRGDDSHDPLEGAAETPQDALASSTPVEGRGGSTPTPTPGLAQESTASTNGVGATDSPPMTEAAASAPVQPAEDATWRVALIGLGVMLLAGAAYMGWKARAR